MAYDKYSPKQVQDFKEAAEKWDELTESLGEESITIIKHWTELHRKVEELARKFESSEFKENSE